jgi:TRAP-type mannitol/chloroaromatic compound transport system permease small subunit
VSTNAGGLISWPAKALLLIGFLQLAAQGVSEIIKKIAVMRGVIDDPTPFISAQEAAQHEVEELVQEIQK